MHAFVFFIFVPAFPFFLLSFSLFLFRFVFLLYPVIPCIAFRLLSVRFLARLGSGFNILSMDYKFPALLASLQTSCLFYFLLH